MATRFEITPLDDASRPWARDVLREHWGSEVVVSRGKMYQADQLPGFVAISPATRSHRESRSYRDVAISPQKAGEV